jgi:hypothetical protein
LVAPLIRVKRLKSPGRNFPAFLLRGLGSRLVARYRKFSHREFDVILTHAEFAILQSSPRRSRNLRTISVGFGTKGRQLAAFVGRSPDAASTDDLRRFRLHQRQNGVLASSMNTAVSALRFFFGVTLDRPDMEQHLTFVNEPRKLPVVLSPEEVARLLNATPERPQGWLFPGRNPVQPMTTRQLNRGCSGRLIIIEHFKRGATPRHQPTAPTVSIRINTS